MIDATNIKNGKPHMKKNSTRNGWCPLGCGKSVRAIYDGPIYHYCCSRCNTTFEKKPDVDSISLIKKLGETQTKNLIT